MTHFDTDRLTRGFIGLGEKCSQPLRSVNKYFIILFSAYSSKAGHACDCPFGGIFVTYCDILYRENKINSMIFYFVLHAVSRLIDLKGGISAFPGGKCVWLSHANCSWNRGWYVPSQAIWGTWILDRPRPIYWPVTHRPTY